MDHPEGRYSESWSTCSCNTVVFWGNKRYATICNIWTWPIPYCYIAPPSQTVPSSDVVGFLVLRFSLWSSWGSLFPSEPTESDHGFDDYHRLNTCSRWSWSVSELSLAFSFRPKPPEWNGTTAAQVISLFMLRSLLTTGRLMPVRDRRGDANRERKPRWENETEDAELKKENLATDTPTHTQGVVA